MWKSIVGSWLNMKPGLTKADPTSATETLRQPLFGNPSILNSSGTPLGLGGLRDGNAFASHGCTRVKDLWSHEEKDWKSLAKLGMSYHVFNKKCKEDIAVNIPWHPDGHAKQPQPGEWISTPNQNPTSLLDWVYLVLQSGRNTAEVIEYKRSAPGGRIQATTRRNL